MISRRACLALASAAPLAGCGAITVGIGAESAPHTYLALHDPAPAPARRAAPLVPALLIQPLPADAVADTAGIAYTRRPHEYAYYQLASWTERPVRQLPRLLQRRLEARGTAGAVGLVGEPLRSAWVLALGVDTLHHDVSGQRGRIALTAELHDRRARQRVARRSFEAEAPAARADSSAAVEAMSVATGLAFDALVPWLEAELERAAAAPGRG